ncbi:hypothetical protein HPB50_019870 [Hyalomma asiaticum]|uniref:Uncharacterized protein n=1 Tax=Hyalomma asiaticum TaxID=266040 RepID=A0ACB7SGI5_HYAAI|nr:hypothetical protein HPB50_019870 [Hyalomma asiaticum]
MERKAEYAAAAALISLALMRAGRLGSPATEDEWITHLRSPDRALQHQAVQKSQKVAGELRLWVGLPGRPP